MAVCEEVNDRLNDPRIALDRLPVHRPTHTDFRVPYRDAKPLAYEHIEPIPQPA